MNELDILVGILGGGGVLIFLFLCLVSILWLFVPFAIFGIKPLLEKVIGQQAEVVKGLEFLSQQNATLLKRIAVNTDPILLTDEVKKCDACHQMFPLSDLIEAKTATCIWIIDYRPARQCTECHDHWVGHC